MAHLPRVPWARVGKLVLLLVIMPAVLLMAAILVFYRLHPWISAPH